MALVGGKGCAGRGGEGGRWQGPGHPCGEGKRKWERGRLGWRQRQRQRGETQRDGEGENESSRRAERSWKTAAVNKAKCRGAP